MAYTPETLKLVTSDVGGQIPRYFTYLSADADATIVGASYFTDGVTKGMRVGDIVDGINATGPKYKRYQVASVSGKAATVAAPTAIT
jgi:predicted metal-dependent RNase